MYHYVRPGEAALPYFRYLHIDNFRRQLDWLQSHRSFPGREEFFEQVASGSPGAGTVLTFDDGFADHVDYVLPELVSRGLWGIFFVPTAPSVTGRLLDVHRIHILLGTAGGTAVLAHLRELVTPEMLSHDHVVKFREVTYARQSNDLATTAVKRALNYFLSYEHRQLVIEGLMDRLIGPKRETELARTFYMRPEQWRTMHDAGMEIGSHGHAHLVMSKLTAAEQACDIGRSCDIIERELGAPVRTFCYPYGGFHSFTAETEQLVDARGILCSFNVEQRDIANADCRDRPHALPRYDCNQFPFGAASEGVAAFDVHETS